MVEIVIPLLPAGVGLVSPYSLGSCWWRRWRGRGGGGIIIIVTIILLIGYRRGGGGYPMVDYYTPVDFDNLRYCPALEVIAAVTPR
ncbi:MAG: hypothetical protein IPP79_12665 [Chitinophagaceae bacterium]|nr:hypothetical protein [Chitinophagaceae bacterium]